MIIFSPDLELPSYSEQEAACRCLNPNPLAATPASITTGAAPEEEAENIHTLVLCIEFFNILPQ